MGMPQRENRPKLDLTPEDADYYQKRPELQAESYYNDPMNDLNAPVPVRKGQAEPNGWTKEAYDINHVDDVTSQGV